MKSAATKQLRLKSCFAAICFTIGIAASVMAVHVVKAALKPAPEQQFAPVGYVGAAQALPTNAFTSSGAPETTLASDTATITAEIVPQKKAIVSDGIPATLSIPSISIKNAAVEQVGVNAKGNVGTPSTFHTVAWYKYGVKPGDQGIALIDGHVNNGLGLSGIFVHLDQIAIGDDIYVADASGKQLHFVVSATSTAGYTDRLGDELDRFTDENGTKSQLMLVTCEGIWVPEAKTYDHRLVVLADLK